MRTIIARIHAVPPPVRVRWCDTARMDTAYRVAHNASQTMHTLLTHPLHPGLRATCIRRYRTTTLTAVSYNQHLHGRIPTPRLSVPPSLQNNWIGRNWGSVQFFFKRAVCLVQALYVCVCGLMVMPMDLARTLWTWHVAGRLGLLPVKTLQLVLAFCSVCWVQSVGTCTTVGVLIHTCI